MGETADTFRANDKGRVHTGCRRNGLTMKRNGKHEEGEVKESLRREGGGSRVAFQREKVAFKFDKHKQSTEQAFEDRGLDSFKNGKIKKV